MCLIFYIINIYRIIVTSNNEKEYNLKNDEYF